MGKIADNAEQQKYNNAAPQQKIFPFAALGEPLGIPQHPNQKCRQPQRRGCRCIEYVLQMMNYM